jgi:hypothetical protein
MIALGDIGDEAPDILSVFDCCIAIGQIGQSDLVTNGNVVIDDEREVRIILGNDAQHLGPGRQAFNHDYADVVLFVMDKQMGNTHFLGSCVLLSPGYFGRGGSGVLIGLI